MNVGIKTGGIWTEIGDNDLLYVFFLTISYHLESKAWGSKYPYLLNKLYKEKLNSEEVSNAIDELVEIRQKFREIKANGIVCDSNDLSKKVSKSFCYKLNASNLSESFCTVSGKNIFDVMLEVLEFSKRRRIAVQIIGEKDLIK